jgi:prephenate dehydratase
VSLQTESRFPQRVAIQGELGSNSHAAALQATAELSLELPQIVPCTLSSDVFDALESGAVRYAVLPIENSLHGSVAEHYDLLLARPVTVVGESLLRVRHNVIAAPGVCLEDVRQILSHPVALSQCRLWLHDHSQITAVPFYDTAGSVKHVIEAGLRDSAGIAPELAASQYGGEVLLRGIEDHSENYTRFYVLERSGGPMPTAADKLSVAFAVEHRPGTLLEALEAFRSSQLNLTRIESRPVHGRLWEYVFFVDVRFESADRLETALTALRGCCQMVQELGRYRAAAV